MKQYRLREGDVTAVDTKTALTTAGSDTAPGALMVPQGVTHITGIRISSMQNMAAATSYAGFVRIEGPGLKGGVQSFAASAGGNAVATGGNAVAPVVEYRVNLPVEAGTEIQIFGEMCGTDIGGLGVQVGLEFSDTPNEGADEHRTITLEGDITTADARSPLTGQGSVSAPSLLVPAGFTKIDKIGVAIASEGLADGKQSFFLRLGGNAVQGGEQLIPVSAAGRIAVQTGSDAAAQNLPAVIFHNVDIAVSPSDSISLWAEGAGDDTGTARAVATLIFAK